MNYANLKEGLSKLPDNFEHICLESLKMLLKIDLVIKNTYTKFHIKIKNYSKEDRNLLGLSRKILEITEQDLTLEKPSDKHVADSELTDYNSLPGKETLLMRLLK